MDPSFDRTGVRGTSLLTQVLGSADALPFCDDSFDIVLCVDTMEHLHVGQRRPALMEMRRIARPGGRVVVAFPADRAGERLDRRLNAAFRRRHGLDHPWLVEHIETGLPRTAEVTADLRAVIRPGDRVRVGKHLSAPAWYLVHRLFTVHHDATMVTEPGPAARALAALMFRVLRSLSLGPTYRRVFTVEVGGTG